mgnify:CR=1 FL=1
MLATLSIALSTAARPQEPAPYGFAGREIYKLAAGCAELAAGDFNGDGLGDLVVANPRRSRIELLLRQAGDAPDWEAPPWRKELPAHPTLAPDGTFRFVVETPHHPILVRVRVRREEPSDRLIFPTRDGFLSETFPLPPE